MGYALCSLDSFGHGLNIVEADVILSDYSGAIFDAIYFRKPVVLLDGFGASSVDYEVSVWIDDPWIARRARSDIREAIWTAFKDHDITIAFPQLDVHVKETPKSE